MRDDCSPACANFVWGWNSTPMTAPQPHKYTNNPQAVDLTTLHSDCGVWMKRLGKNSSLWEITCFLTCSLPSSLLKSICWNPFKALAFPPRVGSSPFVAVWFMFFSAGSSVFAFPRRVLGRARRRLYIIFYSLETLAWCVHMCAQMHVWRSTLEVSLQHSPLTIWDALSLSLELTSSTGWPKNSAIHLSPLLQHRGYCVQPNAWVLRVQIQVPNIVQHTWLAKPSP